jgi:hypothetical protein
MTGDALRSGFYALGIGLSFATVHHHRSAVRDEACFYALGIGLSFATVSIRHRFLPGYGGFYALGIGLSFATDARWRYP